MKTTKRLAVITAAFALAATASGATLRDTVQQFFDQAPTNSWDVSAYAVKLNSSGNGAGVKAYGLGGGAALSYAVTPVLGAKLSADWCDSSWTFASLGMTARGTIHFGTSLSVTPYVGVGPGWNLRGTGQTLVAVAETGATLDVKDLPMKLFGAYQLITASPNQQRILAGLTYRF